MSIDAPAIVRAVESALPVAAPFAVVPLLTAQIPHIDVAAGLALLEQITTRMPASTWGFDATALDRWPQPVARFALTRVRSLPPGKDRIFALCTVPDRLTDAERREVFAGIVDGTLPSTTFGHTKPLSNAPLIEAFIRIAPEDWQETWIAMKADGDDFMEALARRAVGRLTEPALRRMWSRGDDDAEVPSSILKVLEHLPADLRASALARLRASDSRSARLLHLARFDAELTDAERREVVEVPWNAYTRDDPRSQADHLQRVASHLPKVPLELRRRWLHTVLAFTEDFDLQRGLMALLPSLSGADHRQAVDALVASVLRVGRFYTSETRWDLLPDDALGPLLLRLREDCYGWPRDQIIAHLLTARDPALADRCLRPLLAVLGEVGPDHCLEIVLAMTPWLADASAGEVPRSLAGLPVPVPQRPADPLYVLGRAIAEELDALERA